jgi:biopolymer transport protein ExbD
MKVAKTRRRERRAEMRRNSAKLTLTSLIDIFTLLVCFLLVGFQGDVQIPSIEGLSLPISSSYDSPELALTLVVTPQDIRINEKVVQKTDSSNYDALASTLAQAATKFRPSQMVNGSPERSIIILADQKIPYRQLRQIMVICSQQHFGRIAFAVNKEAKDHV